VSDDLIRTLVNGGICDPDSGATLRADSRRVVIERSLAGAEAELVGSLDFGSDLAVVQDGNTRAALGARVERALRSVARVKSIVLDGVPHADFDTVARLKAETRTCDALIAVGSGTINDLCKYVSASLERPYAVFATAPSMNGYTSANAAITVNGLKKTLPARSAAGVFMDLEVLAAAPAVMIRSGLGDSVCRPTAQCDWLLSHLLLGTPYRRLPFWMLEADESCLLERAGALLAGDVEAMRLLARTLILSGFGMTLCGSSAPASQGEHLISHCLDMMAPAGWGGALHGEQIAVTTLTCARLQRSILDGPAPVVAPTAVSAADLTRHFGPDLGQRCWNEFRGKRLDERRAEEINVRLNGNWDAIRTRIAACSRPVSEIEAALRAAGAPLVPADIGLGRDDYERAVRNARYIRNRFTFLDLAAESGLLTDSAVGSL
jgi:glycerol-1-phosphate dehydrogenase [NAD(P)+]